MHIDDVVRCNVRFLRTQHLAGSRDRSLWSQSRVAHRLGLSRPSYIDLELGERRVGTEDLIGLAYLYDVSPQRLLMPPAGTSAVSVLRDQSVDGESFARWVRSQAALEAQDETFFGAHDREQTPAEAALPDGRRTVPSDVPTGLSPPQDVLDAERALAALLRAAAADDEEAMEFHWDILEAAVAAVCQRNRQRPHPEGSQDA